MLAPIHSSLLYLGSSPVELANIDMEVSESPEAALQLLKGHKFKTLIVEDSLPKEQLTSILTEAKTHNAQMQTLVIQKKSPTDQLLPLINNQLIDWLSDGSNEDVLTELLKKSLEKYDDLEQQGLLIQLFDEQNERLKLMKDNLQDRVEKRQKYLKRSEKKLAKANEQIELLHASLIAVHQAQSIKQMESLLYDALKSKLHLDWIRIAFASQSNLEDVQQKDSNYRIFNLPIQMKENMMGKISFARDIRRPFKVEEEELLVQVSEAVSLAISRLIALEESQALKAQWETTFDAFSEPLCLVDQNNLIVRSNQAMVEATGRPYSDLIGKNPFPIMLGDKAPIVEKQMPPFRQRIETSEDAITFDILCQTLTDDPSENFKIVIFRDVTEESRLEKHALESSKMAELGIIGSSIAHELNNPLGGMINFLQLMKMDLKKGDPVYDEVTEMEVAAKRCKDIVESLLGFARKRSEESEDQYDLNEAIHHSLKLVEIQTKSMGIQVNWKPSNESIMLAGNQNQMVQALRNILQNSIEAIERKRGQNSDFIGHIDIDVSVKKRVTVIELTDNGDGIPEEALPKIFNPLFSLKKTGLATGLGLTVAFKIISEQKGSLEISSHQGAGTTARISMESPEL